MSSQPDEPASGVWQASPSTGRAAVLRPWLRGTGETRTSAEAGLEEGRGLATAISLTVVHAELVTLQKARPATLFGSGVVDKFGDLFEALKIDVAIIDAALSPVQQRNLEKAWDCKVIDRTGLILEIFGARARTREGQLQVELAALSYQRSRLVRSWTHLERQRGALGFVGGPGESQLEIDRRLIDERMTRLRKRLDQVRRTRSLHRSARARVPYAVVALVGYTNAGKSTLFNRLTESRTFAHDQLFATLDPSMRSLVLPSGRQVILSDTVGFISDLPPDLIAAFSATLEEVTAADLIVHVRDISHPATEQQKADVEVVLADLEKGVSDRAGISDSDKTGPRGHPLSRPLEILNKIDLLTDEQRTQLLPTGATSRACAISAVTGEGFDDLLEAIERRLSENQSEIAVDLPLSDGASLAWLYRRGKVLARSNDDTAVHVTVRLDAADVDRLAQRKGVTIRS